MNRFITKIRLACLLMVCSLTARAQLTHFQYWFDKNTGGLQSLSLSGEESVVEKDVSTEGLDLGVHTLHFRVRRSDGRYSPVYSSKFVKFEPGKGGMLEYWFDDNFDNRSYKDIGDELAEIKSLVLDLDLSTQAGFPLGLHRLNYRVLQNGRQYSPVYCDYVFHASEDSSSQICFWIDDVYSRRQYLNTTSENGIIQLDKLALNLDKVSPGIHRLHYRIAGNDYDDGVVYETPILVNSLYTMEDADNVTVVSADYWFDEEQPLYWAPQTPDRMVYHDLDILPQNFTEGQHVMYVRYKNSANVWSETNATYFYKTANSKELRLGMMNDETVSVSDLMTDAGAEDTIYDLSGRRIAKPSRGIYIKNGKKVLVR